MMMDAFDLCEDPTNLYLLASALKSFFLIIVTHLLGGEMDSSTLPNSSLASRIWWLVRYFNPLNLCWRYYSMLAYRVAVLSSSSSSSSWLDEDEGEESNEDKVGNKLYWTEKHLAMMNTEEYPYKPPIPYAMAGRIPNLRIRRLQISGILSSQGLLSLCTAYQALVAFHYTVFSSEMVFLPNITMPLAILGIFRAMVSSWVADKVYVKPFPYPQIELEVETKREKERLSKVGLKPHLFLSVGWLLMILGLSLLSFWPYKGYQGLHKEPLEVLKLSMLVLYEYITVSAVLCYGVLVMGRSYGIRALANRIAFFDHWLYHLQTLGFLMFLLGTMAIGVLEFVRHDYYRSCG